jgi:hypothetical protein
MVGEVWGRKYTNNTTPSGAPLGIEISRGMSLHMYTYFDATPNSVPFTWKARSFHPGGVHVGFASGAVRFVADAVDQSVFAGMATLKGGESAVE